MFFMTSTTALYLLQNIARKWHNYLMIWKKHEEVFLSKKYSVPKINMSKILSGIGGFSLLVAFVEHICFLTGIFIQSQHKITQCNASVSVINLAYYELRGHLLSVIGFNKWMIPFLEWTNICMTMAWSSVDIMIVVLSIALIIRFKQFNKRLFSVTENLSSENIWRELRTHYGLLVDLTTKTDKLLSNLIFLSCSNNAFNICMFLFFIGDERSHILLYLQHWITTIYLIVRAFMVLFLGASVNETSRKILPTLKAIPWKNYNIEIKRFIDQIQAEPAVLSGQHFFYLTKPTILAMAGIIVTYEIVLIDQVKRNPPPPISCIFNI
uniref:CSON014091 protein n=1 Tax=Culicoides sonorensis TaxID=179676 RepID=A0A336MAH1_CULSO